MPSLSTITTTTIIISLFSLLLLTTISSSNLNHFFVSAQNQLQTVTIFLYTASPDCDGVFEQADYDDKECSDTRHDTSSMYYCNMTSDENGNIVYDAVVRAFPYSTGCPENQYSENHTFKTHVCHKNSATSSYKFTCDSAGSVSTALMVLVSGFIVGMMTMM